MNSQTYGYVAQFNDSQVAQPKGGRAEEGEVVGVPVEVLPPGNQHFPAQMMDMQQPCYPQLAPGGVQQMQGPDARMATIAVPITANGKCEPTTVVCPNCRQCVVSKVDKRSGPHAYAAAMALVVFMPLICFVPFIKNSCKQIRHYCPGCGANLGKKNSTFC